MRKVNLILFSILCLFIFTFKVDAVCNDKALNEWATNATIEYMEDVDIRDPKDNLIHSKEYLYLLFISTQNEKGKIMVKDSEDENEYEIKYDDEIFYGYVVGSYLHMNEKTYTFTLYGAENSACPNEKLRTIEYKVPAYNVYSRSKYCLENPTEDICKTNSNEMKDVSDKEFINIVNKKEEEQKIAKMNFFEKALYYLKKNWYFIVIPIVLVSAFYAIRIYILKKKVDEE